MEASTVDVVSLITSGFTSLQSTLTSILAAGIPVAVAVLALSVGAKFGLKWIRGLANQA